MGVMSQFPNITSSFFFDVVLFLLSTLVTGPSFMSVSSLVLELWQFCFIRDLEIGNTPVWVFPNMWRLGQVRDTKFGMNISNKILLNAAKCQCYTFYRFWVIKGKPTGVGVKLLPSAPPTQIRVKETWFIFLYNNSCFDMQVLKTVQI